MAQANLAAVLTLDDRASRGLVNASRSARSTGDAFRAAIPSLATFGSSLASLLIATGALNNETGRYVTIALSMSSAIASMLPSLIALGRALQGAAIATNVLNAASGLRLPLVAASLAAGVGTAAFFAGRRTGSEPRTITVNAPNATIRSEEDLNELARRVNAGLR